MSKTVVEKLKEPLNGEFVRQNKDGMDHLEAWHVIEEANNIFGHAGWGMSTPVCEFVFERDNVVLYKSTVSVTADIDGKISTKSGTGFASSDVEGGDLASAHAAAGKNAEADAIKRAMYKFGYRFGLALYDSSRKNVTNSSNPVVGEKVNSENENESPSNRNEEKNSVSPELKELGVLLRRWMSEGKENNSPRKDIVQKYHQAQSKWGNLVESEQLMFRKSFTEQINKNFPKESI